MYVCSREKYLGEFTGLVAGLLSVSSELFSEDTDNSSVSSVHMVSVTVMSQTLTDIEADPTSGFSFDDSIIVELKDNYKTCER